MLLSLLFVNPIDLSEDLLQSGDSIVNVPAGKATRRYIRKWVLFFRCLSGLIMCGCLSLCMYLQYKGNICNRAQYCGSELPEYMALILRNGGSQSPVRWLRSPRNNHLQLIIKDFH